MIEIFIIVVIILSLVVLTVEGILYAVIMSKSSVIAELKQLNSLYKPGFYKVKKRYTSVKRFNNKRSFDKRNFEKVLQECYITSETFWDSVIAQIEANRHKLLDYNEQCEQILYSKRTEWHGKFSLEKREIRLFKMKKLKPVVTFSLRCICEYTSPKGRNHYSDCRTFGLSDLLEIKSMIERQTQFQKSKQYQRLLMTDSLRYDIMKRDAFKCVLCGASANDGSRLHVDHIVPVSRGGKTEMANLRTLCEQCNLGKSNKYDINGIN